jgi:hypothetical protein
MIIGTVKDVLHNQNWNLPPNGEKHCIYLVADKITVFYVGQANNALTRMYGHLGICAWRKGLDELGKFIHANLPDSLGWEIRYLTLQDVEKLISNFRITDYQSESRARNAAEKLLIQMLCPCLNKQHNSNPTPLPLHYMKPQTKTARRRKK